MILEKKFFIMADSDTDILWLTQKDNINYNDPNFDIGVSSSDEELFGCNVVSLEDQPSTSEGHVLYDNVVAEDILSDEFVNAM